jgi:hypothetical protein
MTEFEQVRLSLRRALDHVPRNVRKYVEDAATLLERTEAARGAAEAERDDLRAQVESFESGSYGNNVLVGQDRHAVLMQAEDERDQLRTQLDAISRTCAEHTSDPEREWREFWQEIVAPAGVVDLEQVKKELSDYSMLLAFVPKVYDHVTGGRCTKPHVLPSIVCSLADDHTSACCDIEEAQAERDQLRAQLEAAEAARREAQTELQRRTTDWQQRGAKLERDAFQRGTAEGLRTQLLAHGFSLEDCRSLPEPEIRVHDARTWRAVQSGDGPVYDLLGAVLDSRPAGKWGEHTQDVLYDSAWIAGAKFGWNCRDADDEAGFQGAINARIRDRAELRKTLDAAAKPAEPDRFTPPYGNCQYRMCDLPGQCRSEGKCHHPKPAAHDVSNDFVLRSRVADLIHLLEFADIATPTPGDAKQAQIAMEDIGRMLAAAPGKGECSGC